MPAAIVSILVGALWHGVTVAPGWVALGWLALTVVGSQVCGWFLVALATAYLSSTVSSALLLLTPVGALALATLVLGEQPTILHAPLMLVRAYAASVPSSSWRRFVRRPPGTSPGTAVR